MIIFNPDDLFSKHSSMEVLYFSRFKPHHVGNGGDRRTVQITSTLAGLDFAFINAIDFHSVFSDPDKWKSTIKLRLFSQQLAEYYVARQKIKATNGSYLRWSSRMRDDYYYLSTISTLWRNHIDLKKTKLVIIDDPIYFEPFVEYLLNLGIPVIAVCHNVETLSRPQVEDHFQTLLLKNELDLLRRCSMVVTISQEETFLLRNLGVNTYYYPYHPVSEICDRMLSVRERRLSEVKNDFLLLGTVWNSPTFQGMQNIIQYWQEAACSTNDRLIVAGYGTTQLLGCVGNSPDIVFNGEMSDNELDNVLSTCKGCIVYQQHGSGALTKIPEYLMAGVPVLANSHAARSYHNLPGVIEFEDLNEFAAQLMLLEIAPDDIRIPKCPNGNQLRSRVISLLQKAYANHE